MASVSKSIDVDKLDDIVYKYDNIYYTAIKMKSVDLKQTHILTEVMKLMIKTLKLMVLLEYQNIKAFLQKFTLQISLKKFL